MTTLYRGPSLPFGRLDALAAAALGATLWPVAARTLDAGQVFAAHDDPDSDDAITACVLGSVITGHALISCALDGFARQLVSAGACS